MELKTTQWARPMRFIRKCRFNSQVAKKTNLKPFVLLKRTRNLHIIMQNFSPLLHTNNELSPGRESVWNNLESLRCPMNHRYNTAWSHFISSDDCTNLEIVLSHALMLPLFVVCVCLLSCPPPRVSPSCLLCLILTDRALRFQALWVHLPSGLSVMS